MKNFVRMYYGDFIASIRELPESEQLSVKKALKTFKARLYYIDDNGKIGRLVDGLSAKVVKDSYDKTDKTILIELIDQEQVSMLIHVAKKRGWHFAILCENNEEVVDMKNFSFVESLSKSELEAFIAKATAALAARTKVACERNDIEKHIVPFNVEAEVKTEVKAELTTKPEDDLFIKDADEVKVVDGKVTKPVAANNEARKQKEREERDARTAALIEEEHKRAEAAKVAKAVVEAAKPAKSAEAVTATKELEKLKARAATFAATLKLLDYDDEADFEVAAALEPLYDSTKERIKELERLLG